MMDRVESLMEAVDDAWCDGICRCGRAELEGVSGHVMCVRGLSSSSSVVGVSDGLLGLCEVLDRCGSAVVQKLPLTALVAATPPSSGTAIWEREFGPEHATAKAARPVGSAAMAVLLSSVGVGRGDKLHGGRVTVSAGQAAAVTGGAVSLVSGYGTATSSGVFSIRTTVAGENGVSGSLSFTTGTTSKGSSDNSCAPPGLSVPHAP